MEWITVGISAGTSLIISLLVALINNHLANKRQRKQFENQERLQQNQFKKQDERQQAQFKYQHKLQQEQFKNQNDLQQEQFRKQSELQQEQFSVQKKHNEQQNKLDQQKLQYQNVNESSQYYREKANNLSSNIKDNYMEVIKLRYAKGYLRRDYLLNLLTLLGEYDKFLTEFKPIFDDFENKYDIGKVFTYITKLTSDISKAKEYVKKELTYDDIDDEVMKEINARFNNIDQHTTKLNIELMSYVIGYLNHSYII